VGKYSIITVYDTECVALREVYKILVFEMNLSRKLSGHEREVRSEWYYIIRTL
jgi:hypothetical protein